MLLHSLLKKRREFINVVCFYLFICMFLLAKVLSKNRLDHHSLVCVQETTRTSKTIIYDVKPWIYYFLDLLVIHRGLWGTEKNKVLKQGSKITMVKLQKSVSNIHWLCQQQKPVTNTSQTNNKQKGAAVGAPYWEKIKTRAYGGLCWIKKRGHKYVITYMMIPLL